MTAGNSRGGVAPCCGQSGSAGVHCDRPVFCKFIPLS